MNESDKVTFDSLFKLAEFNSERFDQRRDYSWKVSLGFWAALVGSMTITSIGHAHRCMMLIAGILIPLFHLFCWLRPVFIADKKDKNLAFCAQIEAMKILNNRELLELAHKNQQEAIDRRWYEDWSLIFQFLATLLLSVFAVWFVMMK